MHDTIKGAEHFDISPHFLTQELWDAFFVLVDSHTHLGTHNIWKSEGKYGDSGQSTMVAPVADSAVTAMTQQLLQLAQSQGIALTRASIAANTSRDETNDNTGQQATNRAHSEMQKAADINNESQQTQDPPVDTPSPDQPVGDDGQQANSDNIW
jgi:hypothetical protein